MFHRNFKSLLLLALLPALLIAPAFAADAPATLPRPDGKPADMSKPVKVFIIMGQSNTLEMGNVKGEKDGSLEKAIKEEKLYPFMVDDAGNWTKRMDVRNVHTQGSGGPDGKGGVKRNDWLTVSGARIGIEQGIGHHLGNALDEPVLILKSSIGNRSLGWDILPPGSERYERTELVPVDTIKSQSGNAKNAPKAIEQFKGFAGLKTEGKTLLQLYDEKFEKVTDEKTGKPAYKITYVYAGYGDSPDKWFKGSEPQPITWTAGCQYAGDVARAKEVLKNLETYYPGATKYEIAGFLWWQGDKDRYNPGHAERYEKNLVNLVAALRKEFDAPNAKFVCATLGQTSKENAAGTEKHILDAQLALSDPAKHPQLKGSVATVYTHPLSKGGASNGHYNNDARTYMNVGLAMGEAMVSLLKKQ